MRNLFLGAILVGLVAGLAVVAVRALPSGSTEVPPANPEASPTPDRASPRGTAAAFAAAFEIRDIPALYDLLDDGSRFDRTVDDLHSVYNNFFEETGATGIVADVLQASETGATLAVALSTAYFGDLEYSIALSFTRNGDGDYRIAWTPAAVHPDLRDGRRIEASIMRPVRGGIYDRHGEPLAHTVNQRHIGLNRSIIGDRAAVTAALEEFGFEREAIDTAFDSPIPANQRVGVGVVDDAKIEEANELVLATQGLLIFFLEQRVHPLGPAAAHVVGYTRELTAEELRDRRSDGFRIGDRVGATGIERAMNDRLAGRIGGELRVVDRVNGVVAVLAAREFVEGEEVRTTLDATVLRATHDRLEGRAGAAVVMDPRDNTILALNSSPSFDPNAFERNDYEAISQIVAAEGNPLANRATTGLYAAGSTFKLFTGAAGLMSGLYQPSSTLQCGATWNRFDTPLRNWEGAQGPLTIAQGLMRSCNPVFYEIAYQLYYEMEDGFFSEVARRFGFGSETGVVGIAEEAGLLPDGDWKRSAHGEPWYPGDEVNLGIGQGYLLITPLQLANAYSAFANNRLRSAVILQGEVAEERGEIGLSPAHHAHLLDGLKLVTGPSGTAGYAYSRAGYQGVAGKSGTAEQGLDQQHVLFVALYPADAPVAVAAVVLDDGQSGSLEAGPMARDMLIAASR
jgi:penicillin-binding protein 2